MTKLLFNCLFLCPFLGLPVLLQAEQRFTLTNPLPWTRPAAEIVIPRSLIDLPAGETVTGLSLKNLAFENPFPFQLDDLDGDGAWDELYSQVLIHGGQTLDLVLETGVSEEEFNFQHRTDAMADAADSPDVTKPAWESEVMTYVAYGAAQVDAIGKIAPKLSIDFLYKEPTHSQHGLTVEHGMDFMSVGNTVGAHAPFVREPDGTIVRPWSTDAYLQEASDRVVVASRNVLERTLLVPWMGRAIVATDALSARPIRIPDGAAPEEIKRAVPTTGCSSPKPGMRPNMPSSPAGVSTTP
jgi:hypothetical protein